MITTIIKEYFTSGELADRWKVSQDKLKSIEGLCPCRISPEISYSADDIITYENWSYFTEKNLLERWSNKQYFIDEAENYVSFEEIDGAICYKFIEVIQFEFNNFTKQQELARKWSISVDNIKIIDEFVNNVTLDGTVHYYTKDIDKYQESPVLLLRDWKKRNLP